MEANHRGASCVKTFIVEARSEDGSDDVVIVGNGRVARIPLTRTIARLDICEAAAAAAVAVGVGAGGLKHAAKQRITTKHDAAVPFRHSQTKESQGDVPPCAPRSSRCDISNKGTRIRTSSGARLIAFLWASFSPVRTGPTRIC